MASRGSNRSFSHFAVLGSVAVLFVAPSVAHAEAPVPSQVWAFGTGLHGEPGGITITGSASVNEVTVGLDPQGVTYQVNDPAGLGSPETFGTDRPCRPLDPTTMLCDQLGPSVGAALQGGQDTFVARVAGYISVDGGPGSDVIRGHAAGDYLAGGTQDDELTARSGPDELVGGAGRDSAYGGRGGDLLDLANGDRDRVIACGPGRDDVAVIDRGLDPAPHGCERVRAR